MFVPTETRLCLTHSEQTHGKEFQSDMFWKEECLMIIFILIAAGWGMLCCMVGEWSIVHSLWSNSGFSVLWLTKAASRLFFLYPIKSTLNKLLLCDTSVREGLRPLPQEITSGDLSNQPVRHQGLPCLYALCVWLWIELSKIVRWRDNAMRQKVTHNANGALAFESHGIYTQIGVLVTVSLRSVAASQNFWMKVVKKLTGIVLES